MSVLKSDRSFTKEPCVDVLFNEKVILGMSLQLAPNFNMNLVESFKSELEKRGFTNDLQKKCPVCADLGCSSVKRLY